LCDRWLGTKPWLMVAGIVLGAIVGFYQFIRLTSKL
jgi:F0F1-type ATP synthase assembly protein I